MPGESALAYIRNIGETESTGLLKRIYDDAIGRAGRVANIIKVMSLDAPSAAKSMQFYVSLMKADNALSSSEREMLATVVSNVNGCYY